MSYGLANFPPVVRILFFTMPGPKNYFYPLLIPLGAVQYTLATGIVIEIFTVIVY